MVKLISAKRIAIILSMILGSIFAILITAFISFIVQLDPTLASMSLLPCLEVLQLQ